MVSVALALSAPLSAAAPENNVYASRADETETLSRSLLEALSGLCPLGTEEDFLAIIQEMTEAKDLPIVADSLRFVGQEVGLCPAARAAIAAASEAVQLALAGENQDDTGATGGIGGVPFALSFVASGDTGGPGYIQTQQ